MTARSLTMIGAVGLLTVAGCSKPVDWDLRSLGKGFSTTPAVQNLPGRPTPDSRGVISYPTYQVAVARRGDTVQAVAARIGIDAGALARHNAVSPDTSLRAGEILALPTRVTAPTASSGSGSSTPPRVTTLPSGAEPLRHTVASGETAYSIARLYDVPVSALADWNGLTGNMAVRKGQILLVPVSGAASAAVAPPASAPGTGSPTPTPPSATQPLPSSSPPPVAPSAPATPAAARPTPATMPTPAPTPAPQTTSASAPASARMVMPVSGAIIREYAKGRNEGIDISSPAGTAVKVADSGTVAAITENTNGAKIVVVKHAGGLLTVYVNVSDLTVSKGASVSRGQTIAKVAAGDPPSLHFEVRNGLESVDPARYLP